jgi:hypothetical protein
MVDCTRASRPKPRLTRVDANGMLLSMYVGASVVRVVDAVAE